MRVVRFKTTPKHPEEPPEGWHSLEQAFEAACSTKKKRSVLIRATWGSGRAPKPSDPVIPTLTGTFEDGDPTRVTSGTLLGYAEIVIPIADANHYTAAKSRVKRLACALRQQRSVGLVTPGSIPGGITLTVFGPPDISQAAWLPVVADSVAKLAPKYKLHIESKISVIRGRTW